MGPSWLVPAHVHRSHPGWLSRIAHWMFPPVTRVVDSIAGPPPDVRLADSSGAWEELNSSPPR
jgi:hypothetical protein